MTNRIRREAALKFQKLIDEGMQSKRAIHLVREELRGAGIACSRSRLYVWVRQFKVR